MVRHKRSDRGFWPGAGLLTYSLKTFDAEIHTWDRVLVYLHKINCMGFTYEVLSRLTVLLQTSAGSTARQDPNKQELKVLAEEFISA